MSAPETRFAVLLFTDIVGSTELKARHGVPAYSEALRTHNGHFERIAQECRDIRILHNMGDGYFAEADSVAEAVRFALLFQEAMRAGPWGEVFLTTRVGIHAGELGVVDSEGGSGIVAPAADLTARVMSLAVGGQILLTRFPFDEARHFIREHPPVEGKTMPPLRWLAHGPYVMKGRDEPLEIFEVGAEDLAPLTAPPDGEKAKRAIRPGEEETLGWRPAIGLEIPGRTGWHLTEKLGAGGFGEVWAGEHAKLHQRRAFKFCFDDERLRALKREVTLTRLLRTALGERDDIVRIHELKLDAPPFYIESDLAPHGNLLQWAERQGGLEKIPLAQRIALVAHTATALAAAHSIGVLHKDIKPTNILIFDDPGGEARPRLVDFGIGTLADPGILAQHGVTGAGFTRATIEHSPGTPTYSPPEYLAGKPYTIQGDIYGLGVLLFQLITIKPLEPIATGWERDVSNPLLREDIAACVDGDPARRLPSAADLAERLLTLDVRRVKIIEKERLTQEAAVRADADAAAIADRTRAIRFRKLATAFGILSVMAIAGGVLAGINQHKADAALGEVAQKKVEVDRKNDEYRTMLEEAARSDRFIAEEKLRAGDKENALAHLSRACDYDRRSTLAAEKAVAALSTWSWSRPLPSSLLQGHEGPVLSAQFSPDGTRIVTASLDGIARVWDVARNEVVATLTGHTEAVRSAQFSPDGTQIVTASKDHTARVWDAVNGKVLATLTGHKETVLSAQFSPDGARIVTASEDKTARVWDAASGESLATLADHAGTVFSAQFSPDGARVVTASEDKTTRVWDATTGKGVTTLAGHDGGIRSAQFSPDGARIVTASEDKTARVWDAASGKVLATFIGHEGGVESAHFSPDGSRIVTAAWDNIARVWDAVSGKLLITLVGHEKTVRSAHFSPDNSRIVTASKDNTARIWDTETGKVIATLVGHSQEVVDAQFSPRGTHVVTVSLESIVRVWDLADSHAGTMLFGHESRVATAQFNADSSKIVTASWDKTARVWDAGSGNVLATLTGHRATVNSAQFNPDGSRIVTASSDETARVWDAATGNVLATLNGHRGSVESAQFSPNGSRIVTASRDRTARVWDANSGKVLTTLAGVGKPLKSALFSPDGSRIVTVSEDWTAQVWDASSGAGWSTIHGNGIESAQFSPEGSRIITGSYNKTAEIWDADSGRLLTTLVGHEETVRNAQFSLDGSRIVTASDDKTARIWDAVSGKSLVTLTGHKMAVNGAQFSPDGSLIVTASEDGTARVWATIPPSSGSPPLWFSEFLRYTAQRHLTTNGEMAIIAPSQCLAAREKLRAVRRASVGQDTPYLRILRRFVPE